MGGGGRWEVGDLWTCCYIVLWHTDVFIQISTLKFATRMMCVSNEPVQNILHDPQVRHLRTYLTRSSVAPSSFPTLPPSLSTFHPPPPQLLIKQYEQEIRALRLELAMHDTLVRNITATATQVANCERYLTVNFTVNLFFPPRPTVVR